MQIRQLLYFSLTSRNLSEQDLSELLEDSRERNIVHDVTGLLIYVGNYFIQHIEGPPSIIDRLTKNIRADNRISDFTVLIDETRTERMFPNWRMGFRTQSTSGVKGQSGFVNVIHPDDFDHLVPGGDKTRQIMKKFYDVNKDAPQFH